jgi:Txe/YoeB family toxin of Txe-Axe toxin-antitoxin module
MKISFVNDDVFEDYNEWTINDKKIAKKIMTLNVPLRFIK